MNILITGGNGYVANSLYESLKNKYNVLKISRDNFDLTNRESTDIFFRHRLFDVVIHCAVKGGSRLKQDDRSVLDDNLMMYYNILANKQSYEKLIHFGSGAELNPDDTLYGFSKSVIRKSIMNNEDSYNLRIYAVFDENELDTRFIKSNINNYINKRPIVIHQNKNMSFFYMKDLITLVDHYINQKHPEKEMNCCYTEMTSLEKIANIINNLDSHKVKIIKQSEGYDKPYYGFNLNFPKIELIGLENGIKEMYNNIKCKELVF